VSQLFEIDVDYYHMPQRSGMRESDFERASLHWSLPAERAALVLVDMWNEHYVLSHLERGGQITRERIVPLAQAFRDAGATVVHAPSPDCLHRYEQRLTRVEGTPAGPAVPPRPEPLLPDWPPAEFRRKEGEFAGLGKPRDEKDAEFDRIIAERHLMPQIEPHDEDALVFTGDQLHAVLRDRGATTLFYCGFAANFCVPNRDYGMRAMRSRGYDIVLVRDCTSAIEVADTVDDLVLTAAAVRDVEVTIGYSIDSQTLRAGLGREGPGRA
jgi:nicotinamidase-related amidase